MALQQPTAIVSHESAMGRWEMALRKPHPALRIHVRQYCGWVEHMATALTRREIPTEVIPVIINFGSPVRVYGAGESDRFVDLNSFTTGAYDRFVRVRTQGPSGGIQVNFTILGARLFLGRPIGELVNRSIALEELLGAGVSVLTEQLRDLPDWDARFDLLDRFIGARLEAAKEPPASVVCGWHRLWTTGGASTIADLVAETGWSHKHLIAQFRHEVGLAPKTLARVLRFSRAAGRLRSRPPESGGLADVAASCGYYDQSHFIRDFRAFAGVTPVELLASVLPDGAGIQAGEPR